jgi:hypothetical protein
MVDHFSGKINNIVGRLKCCKVVEEVGMVVNVKVVRNLST